MPGAFAQPELVRKLLSELQDLPREFRLMEVCGTHTMALFETGLRPQLSDIGIELLSGPGCPVCVTAQSDLDHLFAIAAQPDVVLCTFGDMLRVPGTETSLEELRGSGSDIRIIYSPLDAVELAQSKPGSTIVLLAVGFETTAPAIAWTINSAISRSLANFQVFPINKTVPPALHALASRNDLKLDGMLLPGHVSVVTGSAAFEDVAQNYDMPCAIAGFEPIDILRGVISLARQVSTGSAEVENCYSRVVTSEGNRIAQDAVNAVFEPADAEWRGLGVIPRSGLELRESLAHLDARRLRPELKPLPAAESTSCRCGDVLCGVIQPTECSLFGTSCTPDHPLGACMVSQEGSCRAYFKYYGNL